ncbi:MAG: hypothetical protein A2X18_08940 [Bacteroidetes bacterium GWF2_40_14]|nr:MAG: hypothetical protein A2X18_08940 [Bacteroidetes bacterium GWF2_40_14]
MKNCSNIKRFLLFQLPYIFYISILIFWFYNTYSENEPINYIALVIAMLVFIQFVFQNKFAGASLGAIGVALSLFFLFSFLSEYKDVETGSLLMVVGLIIASLSLVMGLVMTISSLTSYPDKRKRQ